MSPLEIVARQLDPDAFSEPGTEHLCFCAQCEESRSTDRAVAFAKADEIMRALAAQQDGARPLPHKESIAREIRRAMLDNPTDASFNARAQKREKIADATADVILDLFRRVEQKAPT